MLVRRRRGRLVLRQADAARRAGQAHRRRAYDPAALVWTAWDLGIRDSTAIWFAQTVGREIGDRLLRSLGRRPRHYVREINARPYLYAGHIVPHDAQSAGARHRQEPLEVMASLGLKTITVAPTHRIEDGINAVRLSFRVLVRRGEVRAWARGVEAVPVGV